MPESRVSVARLKARLSEYLARAKAGEPVIITDRGTPVARLVPLSGPAEEAGRRTELGRAGLIRDPERAADAAFLERFLAEPRPADPTGRSLESVLEERAEGW